MFATKDLFDSITGNDGTYSFMMMGVAVVKEGCLAEAMKQSPSIEEMNHG